jgi:excisionase family DNA binding protein
MNFLNTQQAASLLQLSLTTVYRLVSERKITYYKPTNGRLFFREEDIESFIEAGKQDVDQTSTTNLNPLKWN